MRILHIITRLIVGGAQENTLLTCEGLHARGHEVTLLTGPSPGPEGTLMDRAHAGGYKVILTPHLVRAPNPWHDHFAYYGIRKMVREMQPDFVHTHSSKAGILGRAAAWSVGGKRGKPLVVHTIHGLPFHPYQNAVARNAWITLERFAAKRCHAIISVADAMTWQARAAGIGKPEQFTTIYSAMETEKFLNPGVTREAMRERLNIPRDRFVFGTIARLQPLKGHDDLLAHVGEVLAKIPNAHFLWVGDGIFRQRFEHTIRDKNWQSHFTLTGLIRPDEVPFTLAAMDALVHPSYREGLARALPQALLAGVPVISYDCDGAAEVCLENQTGFLVKTGDAAALAQSMIRMASDPVAAKQMGERGREICRERFAANTMVKAIENLYWDTLAPLQIHGGRVQS